MGTPADVARLLERLTDSLMAVESNLTQLSTQQVNVVERLENVKSGLEISHLQSGIFEKSGNLWGPRWPAAGE